MNKIFIATIAALLAMPAFALEEEINQIDSYETESTTDQTEQDIETTRELASDGEEDQNSSIQEAPENSTEVIDQDN